MPAIEVVAEDAASEAPLVVPELPQPPDPTLPSDEELVDAPRTNANHGAIDWRVPLRAAAARPAPCRRPNRARRHRRKMAAT